MACPHLGLEIRLNVGAFRVLSILIVAAAPNLPVFVAGWLLAGLSMASTFYQPAFAALTRWWVPDHIRALTVVTLAGGLASTVFAPSPPPSPITCPGVRHTPSSPWSSRP
jgi:MFS family permease